MRLRSSLARLDAGADQQQALDQSIAQLDELFLLVVVGESPVKAHSSTR